MDHVERINGVNALVLASEGPRYGAERGAGDLVGDALGHGAELVVMPVGRLADDFFVLRTGVAGEILQKLVNYRVRLAVIGDVPTHVGTSGALRDLIRESNRGRDAWFLPDRAALEARLA
ncbi:DUF4180 domain-containing protein [Dactylosporangium sp. CA-052675]|uniref:DUF4180 domain-containing protein n=1 Tax=Dactylosporangium sp. CA-052675 TaxID=3239927 RepID=UPI003D9361B9